MWCRVDLGKGGVQVTGREALVTEIRPVPQVVVEVSSTIHADRPPFSTGLLSASIAARRPAWRSAAEIGRYRRERRQSGDLGHGVVQVVVQDHHGPLVSREPHECPVQLVAVGDRHRAVRHPSIQVEQVHVRWMAPSAQLVAAGVDEHAVGPTIETIHVTQPGKLLPDLHKRVLGHVAGELAVAQDPMRHRVEPIASSMASSPKRLGRPDAPVGRGSAPRSLTDSVLTCCIERR